MIAAGLILGVVALFSMRRYGRERILGRAIGGLLFNGFILVAIIVILAPSLGLVRTKKRVVGHWRLNSIHGVPKIDLSLDENGQFTLKSSNGASPVASMEGHWIMTPKKTIGVTIERVSGGSQSTVGTKFGLGTVKSVDDEHLILQTDNGEETYARE
ncbi:MAG TPA: hypothetical protein VFC46_02620 [Humisphaera sp.]|nr:hypothetical protein [Humisphaera sp.]